MFLDYIDPSDIDIVRPYTAASEQRSFAFEIFPIIFSIFVGVIYVVSIFYPVEAVEALASEKILDSYSRFSTEKDTNIIQGLLKEAYRRQLEDYRGQQQVLSPVANPLPIYEQMMVDPEVDDALDIILADMLRRQELGQLQEQELIDLYYYIYNLNSQPNDFLDQFVHFQETDFSQTFTS